MKLKAFVGLQLPEISEVMGLSATTIKRRWKYVRAWLYVRIENVETAPGATTQTG